MTDRKATALAIITSLRDEKIEPLDTDTLTSVLHPIDLAYSLALDLEDAFGIAPPDDAPEIWQTVGDVLDWADSVIVAA